MSARLSIIGYPPIAFATATVTTDELRALHASPKVLTASPGAGSWIMLLTALLHARPGLTPWTIPDSATAWLGTGSGDVPALQWAAGIDPNILNADPADSVQLAADAAYGLADSPDWVRTRALSYFAATDRDDQPLILALNADGALELTDGDGALDVLAVYLRLPLP